MQVLHALYKKHHWHMHGPTFHTLHLLLDEHVAALEEQIDALAERVQQLGGVATGDLRHIAELTTLERPPDDVEPVAVMLARLITGHEQVITQVRAGLVQIAEGADAATSDLLVSGVLRTHEQQVWFLAEHL